MSNAASSSTSLTPATNAGSNGQTAHLSLENSDEKNSVVIKVGMVGDSQIGKTSLMVKYVEGSFDEDYIQTLGVNFMEKTISVRRTTITFSIWDLGGQREFVNMLPLTAIPFLIGTKFDTFATFPRDEQEEITKQVLYSSLTMNHL
ncbi:hypothetical protein H0H92_006231 [Tricholoma furcatifolium]|nr:hypothetical protein H0H92_006231 [Tricholoma furcatifolium]